MTSVDQERLNCKKPQKDGNKKIIAYMILLFAAVFALLLGIAGACIGLKLSKLQNDQNKYIKSTKWHTPPATESTKRINSHSPPAID